MAFRTNKVPVLQEKLASGAVAAFNTALAMPLSSCNIAVNAWQEGSGDPNPIDNIRPIHGWTECNAYQRSINLWDEQYQLGNYSVLNGDYESRSDRICTLNKIPIKPDTTYYFKTAAGISVGNVYYYDKNEDYISYDGSKGNRTFTTPANCCYINIVFGASYGTTYNNDISINYPSSDTIYHAYTGNTYTIQFGQEVYGAKVDADNGVATVTHSIIPDMSLLNFVYNSTNKWFTTSSITDIEAGVSTVISDITCEQYKAQSRNYIANNLSVNYLIGVTSAKSVVVRNRDYDDSTLTDFVNSLSGRKLAYPLETPFDIQLTPTQIKTLIGNNTIFADTGDVDLTYKDLDIAKRGNFREVFKLPS